MSERAENGPIHLSYSGLHSARPEVVIPRDVDALREALHRARDEGRRITLRGGGMSLDSHSIGSDLAVVMTAFNHLEVDEAQGLLRVGVGVTWGEVLERLRPLGLVPPVMVTTTRATIGGTLSANSLSRFSCIYGREGASLRSLKVMTADGALHTCSRTENPQLFFGVVGGYGNIAVVVEATYKLLKKPSPVQVETRFVKKIGTRGLAQSLKPEAGSELAKCAVFALYKGTLRQLYTTSLYTSGPWLKRVWLYKPVDAFRVLAEMVAYAWPWMASLIWNLGFRFILRGDTAYRDPLRDFTFFTDGNVRARANILRLTGEFTMLEQTYIIPEGGDLEGFVEGVRVGCRRLGVYPLIFDVTWLPEDEPFLLSSTRGMAGYAVNIAFEGTKGSSTEMLKALFVDLSEACFSQGGRVHLTKNVFARPETLKAMYEAPLEELLSLRERVDPLHTFGSGFLERVMGLGGSSPPGQGPSTS